MGKNLSRYEEEQVTKFLYEMYLLWGGSLDADTCIGEGWITYLEGREKYKYHIGDVDYWEYVHSNVKRRLEKLKQVRNERIRLESKLSLNQTFGETKEEIGTIIARKSGDFANSVVLWDYINRLGDQKYKVLKLMYVGEEDYDIMNILHLSQEKYYEIKRELRTDFQHYQEII